MSPFTGDEPQVTGVAQPRAVADERLLGVVLALDEHDRAVQLARAHEPAAERILDVAAQPDADVAGHLDALVGLHAELLDRGPVAVVAFLCHLSRWNSAICSGGSGKVLPER